MLIAFGLQVPDMRNIHSLLTITGHLYGHQSGLDERSGRNSTIFLHGVALHVYLVFSQIGKHITYLQILTKNWLIL